MMAIKKPQLYSVNPSEFDIGVSNVVSYNSNMAQGNEKAVNYKGGPDEKISVTQTEEVSRDSSEKKLSQEKAAFERGLLDSRS